VIAIPAFEEQPQITDWAELSCLFSKYSSLSRAEIVRSLEAANLSDPESRVENIWAELDCRQRLATTAHPIVTTRTHIKRIKDYKETLAYAFQLLIATHSFYKPSTLSGQIWNTSAKLFETLTTTAIAQYLGGKALNVGAPRSQPIPAKFSECLDYMCSELTEMRGSVKSYASRTKDDALDILTWRPFTDCRAGQLVVLVQCAAGAYWEAKAPELVGNLRVWQDYIDFAVPPVTAFAFPFVCLESLQWKRLSRQGGLLLDRLRIASLCSGKPLDERLQKKLLQWCKTQASYLPRL